MLLLAAPVALAHVDVIIPADDNITVATMTLKQGDVIDFSFTAQGPVKFEINLLGGQGQYSQTGVTGSGRFTIPMDGTYTFKFDNQNVFTPVSVSYAIEKVDPSAGLILLLLLGITAGVAILALVIFIVLHGHRRMGQRPLQ